MQPLCPAPWITIYRKNKLAYPCCEAIKPYELVTGKNTNTEIFNSASARGLREQMFSDKLPDTCKHCIEHEDVSVKSLRQQFWILIDQGLLKFDQSKTQITYLDHRESNLCNFSCKMCGKTLSSTHQIMYNSIHENTKSNGITYTWVPEKIYDDDDKIDMLHFAGGEPTLMPGTYAIIKDQIKNKNSKNQSLSIISNTSQYNNIIEQLPKHFKHVDWTASIDCMGKAHDWWRHKGSWEKVEKNLERLIKLSEQYENFEVKIRSTIGWPTLFALSPLHAKYSNRVNIDIGLIVTPAWLSPHLITPEIKQRLLDIWKEDDQMFNIISSLRADPDPQLLSLAKLNFKLADKYHGNSFQDAFPEYIDFFNKVL